jgi:hypothetical protein
MAARKFTFRKQFSLVTAYAGCDDVRKSEAYTKESIRGRDPGSFLIKHEYIAWSDKRCKEM